GKLKVRVGADRVHIKEIRHTELAETNLQSPPRQLIEQRQKTALILDLILAQGEYFVDHAAPQIWRFAQQRVPHNVQIRISRQAEAQAERRAARFFDVHQKLGGIIDSNSGVEGHYPRSRFRIIGTEAVCPAVIGVKIGMSLKNKVCLPGEPETRALEMRKHGFGIGA